MSKIPNTHTFVAKKKPGPKIKSRLERKSNITVGLTGWVLDALDDLCQTKGEERSAMIEKAILSSYDFMDKTINIAPKTK